MKVKLIKLSICPCGFPTLDDQIVLGTQYEIQPETIQSGFSYICGGCGKMQDKTVTCVQTSQLLHPELDPAPLPLELFSYSEACHGL
jgi:hypothetical protein